MKVPYLNTVNKVSAYEVVKKNITPETINKFKVTATVDYDDKNYKITGKGKGFTLVIQFNEKEVDIDLDLSLLLKPFKASIVAKVESMLKKIV
ncbi:MAG: polyhydroxyalkanoic acid system family protein [Bacteriovoracaceae bacterium]